MSGSGMDALQQARVGSSNPGPSPNSNANPKLQQTSVADLTLTLTLILTLTLTLTLHSKQARVGGRALQFDVVVVDEATQSSEARLNRCCYLDVDVGI